MKREKTLVVNYREQNACLKLTKKIKKLLPLEQEVTFLCIGTDQVLIDIFGPLVGTLLKETGLKNVLGVLGEPVHAKNLREVAGQIPKNNFVVAIDAMSGAEENLGNIRIRKGRCYPGTGINKKLIPVGDLTVSFNVVVEKAGGWDLSVSSELVWCGAKLVASAIINMELGLKKFSEPMAVIPKTLPQGYWRGLFSQYV